ALVREIVVAKLFYCHAQSIVDNTYSKIDVLNEQNVQERHQVETTLLGELQVVHLLRVLAISLVKIPKKYLDLAKYYKLFLSPYTVSGRYFKYGSSTPTLHYKFATRVHDEIVSSITSTSAEVLSPSLDISSSDLTSFPEKLDYDLLEKHNELKLENENRKTKFYHWKSLLKITKKINEYLRTSMKKLQKNLNLTNSILKQKKKRVRWTRDDVAKAFTLRYLSKRAYGYVKNELHYPLPGN
ncbi:Uncharacterized protein FWK35_00018311, partial [Aphis craccivora]